jgi:1-aminocyclopropane-1-carboxylate deaminase/D-cysteine desulfhydrase-like pyridoxal-dependent ACC family enzyme
LRAALAQGLAVYPVRSGLEAIGLLPHLLTPRDFLLAPGALGPAGSSGFVSAIEELGQQIAAGVLPQPQAIVVAAGTGSTAAGLLLGLATGPVSSRLVAVAARSSRALRGSILAQALLTAAHLGLRVRLEELRKRLEVRSDLVGPGYGQPTETTSRAEQIAEGFALTLEPTYTARAFAHALRLTGHPRFKGGPTCERVLYWHTLSTAPMTPLLATAIPLPDAEWFERLLPRPGKPQGHEARW